MNKKTYMAPALTERKVEIQNIICASVTTVAGDAGITLGEGDAPTTADSRFTLWEEEE